MVRGNYLPRSTKYRGRKRWAQGSPCFNARTIDGFGDFHACARIVLSSRLISERTYPHAHPRAATTTTTTTRRTPRPSPTTTITPTTTTTSPAARRPPREVDYSFDAIEMTVPDDKAVAAAAAATAAMTLDEPAAALDGVTKSDESSGKKTEGGLGLGMGL